MSHHVSFPLLRLSFSGSPPKNSSSDLTWTPLSTGPDATRIVYSYAIALYNMEEIEQKLSGTWNVTWIVESGQGSIYSHLTESEKRMTMRHYWLNNEARNVHFLHGFRVYQIVGRADTNNPSTLLTMTTNFKDEGEFYEYKRLVENARSEWVKSQYHSKSSEDRADKLLTRFVPKVDALIERFTKYLVPFDLRKCYQLVETFHMKRNMPGEQNPRQTVQWPLKELFMDTEELKKKKFKQTKLAPKKRGSKKNRQRKLTSYFKSTQDGSMPILPLKEHNH